MKCPNCESLQDSVVDSRPLRDFSGTRRRRKCTVCGHAWTTYEYSQGDFGEFKGGELRAVELVKKGATKAMNKMCSICVCEECNPCPINEFVNQEE